MILSSQYSKHSPSQSVRVRELKFWENVTCHASCVTYHMSGVTCQVSHIMCIFLYLDFLGEINGGGSVINGFYPVQFLSISLKKKYNSCSLTCLKNTKMEDWVEIKDVPRIVYHQYRYQETVQKVALIFFFCRNIYWVWSKP